MTDFERTWQCVPRLIIGQSDHAAWTKLTEADWSQLVDMAEWEGVAPLLYRALDNLAWPTEIPSTIRQRLRAAYHTAAAWNLLFQAELIRILTALTELPSHPPVLVLKGAALAVTLYPDPALRPLSDLDLLIPRAHVSSAARVLNTLGYRRPTPEMSIGLDQITSYHLHLHGGPQGRVMVELHWNLVASDTDWRAPTIEWFWQQAEPFALYPKALTLTPTAHLLYLAAHLMLQHGGAHARLVWFYDLHLLIERCSDRLDWDLLLAQARAFRWAEALYAALQGVQERFDTPLPPGYLEALAVHHDPQAARLVQRKADSMQTRATAVWDHLSSLNWPARLRLVWGLICPSPAYMRWRYPLRPAWLWPLSYPYRWVDILWEGARTLWRRAKRRISKQV